MAEAIAFDFLKSLVGKLFFAAVKEIYFAAEKDSHIKSLAEKKAMIAASLLGVDATVNLEDGRQVDRQELQRLSCALDKIDDLLDETTTRSKIKEIATFKERVRLFFSINSNPVVSLCRDIRHVKDIRTELDSIVKDHALLQSVLSMLPKTVSQTPTQNRDMGSDVIKEEVIGRDQDRDDIIRRLLHPHDHSSPFSVIAIVGIGGMGKTKLAQYVYNDRRVEEHFDKLLWVHASRDFDAEEILAKILASAKRDQTKHFEMHVAQRLVQQEIEGRKYLLVLDDVWDDNQKLRTEWQTLTTSLAHGGTGSKVLITTRDEGVAGIVDSTQPHKLTVLGKEDSWVLFQRVAFPHEGLVEQGLKDIGQEILEKCPRAPLVIRAIGGLLRDQGPNKDKWQAFRDGPLQNLSTAVPDIMESLKLSYNQLDRRLKLCFAYCSLFPRGWKIEKDRLICLWIALGYVEARYPTQSLEDAGEEYVLGLMNRGFFQDAKKDKFGCITSFRMHDMMHDLTVLVAGSKYKMFDSDSVKTDHVLDERVGHVSFWEQMENLPSLLLKNKENLQSLLFYSQFYRQSELQLNGLSRFRHLRAVSLRDSASDRELAQSIGKLIHLRYLDLSFAESIRKLPSSITQLVNLFYLDLSECWYLKELPRDISKLVKLRHLNLAGCWHLKLMPSGLGNLTNLQTLGLFALGEENSINRKDVGGLDELKCLNNLKGGLELVVRSDFEYGWADDKLRSYVTEAASLQGKGKLVSVEIDLGYKQSKEKSKIELEGLQPHSNLRQLNIEGYNGERLPSWMMSWGWLPYNSLPNLVEITLSGFQNCRYLSSFGRLPHLKVLILYNMRQLECVENTSTAAGSPHPSLSHPLATASAPNPLFPSLEYLRLEWMPKLKGWRKMMCTSSTSNEEESQVLQNCCYYSAFPRLKELVFSAVGLEFVPEEFRDLPALESLGLYFCSQLKEVPEWIDTLTSLKKLEITCCDKLTSLPKEMTNLSNLENLEIRSCPILEKRCEKPTGEDWRLIQHVPRVLILGDDY